MRHGVFKMALAVTGTFTLSTAALAQTEGAGSGKELLEEIVITGSRVVTNGDDAPTPVTVVDVEQLATTRPTTVFEGLNDMPVFSGSRGQTAAVAGGGAYTQVAAISLRGLGTTRNLILYDGKRVPPTTTDGQVDINMLPQLLLKRVDVVTGGASAVYGSEAISGVVNFITDRTFNGLKFNVQGGVSRYGDDQSWDAGLAWGTDLFGGRGHLEASFQTRDSDGIPDRLARDLGYKRWTLQGNGSTATPYKMVPYVTANSQTPGGLISGGVLGGRNFSNVGVLTPFQTTACGAAAGFSLACSVVQVGGNGGWHTSPNLKGEQTLNQAFARFDFDVTDNLHTYVNASWALVDSSYNGVGNRISFAIHRDNAFLAQQYRTELVNAGQTTFTVGKFTNNFESNWRGLTNTNLARNYFVTAGLEGKFGDGYNWEVSVTNSEATLKNVNLTNRQQDRIAAALDAVVDPATGQIVCYAKLQGAPQYQDCVPLNLFGPGSESVEAISYILQPTYLFLTTTLDGASGSITGAPFSTWAGEVNMALSAETRKMTYKADSTAPIGAGLLLADCAGGLVRYNCTPTTAKFSNGIAPRSKVSQKVSEAALEVNLPMLREMPAAQSVDVNAAVRFTDYDTSGEYTTWKGGVTWDFNDWLTLRAARSRDIRAPNLNDLFAPGSATQNSFFIDRLTGAQFTNASTVTGGNPALTPEVGDTTTLGLVIRPLPNLSIALDAYQIKITDAIATANGNQDAIQDACYASRGSSQLCTLITRPSYTDTNPATNVVTRWIQGPANIGQLKTEGIDLETNFNTRLLNRPFNLRFLASYQPHTIYIQNPLPTVDVAGYVFNTSNGNNGNPVVRASLFARLAITDKLSVDVLERWRSSMEHITTGVPGRENVIGDVPSIAYTNLNVSYQLGSGDSQTTIFANVQNLFDKDPPPSANPGQADQPGLSGGFVPGDDVVGRYFTVGLRARF